MANIRHNLKNLLLKGKSFVSVINSSKENILNGNLDKRGWQSVSGGGPVVPSYDPDAQAFITAANITDSTQKTAINTLVTDLKTYSIWNKMKAVYPIVGGSATAHKFNLKDPRDLDAAFRLVFNGGMTHSNTGILFGGVNGYADSKLNLFNNYGSSYNNHFSVYYRTNNKNSEKIGANDGSYYKGMSTHICYSDDNTYNDNMGRNSVLSTTYGNSAASHISSLLSTTSQKMYRNGVLKISGNAFSGYSFPSFNFYFGGLCENGTAVYFSNREVAFGSIGDGLSDTEAANLYTSIQKFQTTLNRFVGTPIYTSFDSDAQSFMTSASITDSTQQAAVNYLVTDLKSNNLWSKMKAIYPMVGGTATSHSYNLKNPSQYQITWNGGLTHSSNGVLPNGTNGYGNTNLNPSSFTSLHYSYYSRTTNTSGREIGIELSSQAWDIIISLGGTIYGRFGSSSISSSNSDSKGFYLNTEASTLSHKLFKNNTQLGNISFSGAGYPNYNVFICAINILGGAGNFGSRQCAFSSIGDGLTDTEASNLYTIIQNYQTILSRQV